MLLAGEPDAEIATDLFRDADRVSTSLVAYAECRSALAAAVRRRRILPTEARKGVVALEGIWTSFDRLTLSEAIVRHAGELAERRALRGFDAIHLASALAQAPEVVVACWDDQLARATRAEGLPVVGKSRA